MEVVAEYTNEVEIPKQYFILQDEYSVYLLAGEYPN